MEILGFCEDKFSNVKEAFEKNFKEGKECGASFSVNFEGKTVIDLWGGYADPTKTKPWQEDTIVNVWSTSKFVTAVCVWLLIERKLIDVDAPVADYWSEFAQAGKEGITVGHLLSHTSGLAGWTEQFETKDFFDWKKLTEALSRQKPWWDDRQRAGYHVFTFGYLLGEVIRRVTNKSIGQFLREEITEPLNIDFYIGLSDIERPKVATIIPEKRTLSVKFKERFMVFYARKTFFSKAFPNPLMTDDVIMTKEWQSAEIPAANGHGNANSIAKIGAIIANDGEVDGIRFLSPGLIERALEIRNIGKDLVLNMPCNFGLGFGTNLKGGIFGKSCPNPRTLYWGGMGGSVVIADLEERISIAYAMNKKSFGMTGDPRGERLIKAVYSSL